ncbi:MAG: ATP-binding cassette domain-containing protein [Cytophagia bacterium]|nr:ATP-binding cassette domain-containing protein [Cytophagia bacterium]
MSDIVIKVENLSKQYRLGTVGTGTISHDLNRWWAQVRGKEDPFLKIGEANDRSLVGNSDYVWSLKGINFEVKQGEILGIIGKNGAGKSTLLKILSKVTGPTTGRIMAKGRIGALLEVGTGFHPELTGRENIFLNGAILGMTKTEIKAKLDEIIDFSGCARYIDTPVKRYSSGMKVRLAFAVAAFLEPEILIVDEVLAVGDAEFQKKAIGKMQDVSRGEGRTVLFVSHNMAAVKSLCSQAILMENGSIKSYGQPNEIIKLYLGGNSEYLNFRMLNESSDGLTVEYVGIKNLNNGFDDPIQRDKEILLEIKYHNHTGLRGIYWNIKIKDEEGNYIISTTSFYEGSLTKLGKGQATMKIPAWFFNEGTFSFDLQVLSKTEKGYKTYFLEKDLLLIQILPEIRPIGSWMGKEVGVIRHRFDWVL